MAIEARPSKVKFWCELTIVDEKGSLREDNVSPLFAAISLKFDEDPSFRKVVRITWWVTHHSPQTIRILVHLRDSVKWHRGRLVPSTEAHQSE